MTQEIKTIVISLALFIVVIGALILLKNDKSQTAAIDNETAGGMLTVKENFYDFGSVKINGGLVDHTYALENTSDKSIKISSIVTSCMCTEAELNIRGKTYGPFGMPGHFGTNKVDAVVDPKEKFVVKAIFNPAAHGPAGIGDISREIYISTDANQTLVLNFKAKVTP